MDSSLFAVFQIIDALVRVHPRAADWFARVERHHPLTQAQRDALHDNRSRTLDVEALFRQITRDEDRLRLVNWVRMLGESDGHLSTEDQEVLRRARAFALPPMSTYADALVAHEKNIEFWRDLEALGTDLKRTRRLPVFLEQIFKRL